MGRIIAAAALGAACLAAVAAGGEYEPFSDDALGLALSAPPGYEAEAPEPAEGLAVNAVRLSWPQGPYAGLEVLITRREGAYANVVMWAGFYQRRRGASSSFEAEGEHLGEEDLAAAAADDGVRASYIIGEQETRRYLETLFLKSANDLYVVEVSCPELVGNNLSAAAQGILSTAEILPPPPGEEAEANGGPGAGIEPPAE